MIMINIDMPKSCESCPLLCVDDFTDDYCCCVDNSIDVDCECRPDGCPIKAEITSDSLLKALISEVMTPEQIQEALIIDWLNSFNTDSAPKCFEAVQLLKAKVNKGKN